MKEGSLYLEYLDGERKAEKILKDIQYLTSCLEDQLFTKMTVAELRKYVSENEILLPQKGSGKKGNLIKKDYIEAIQKFRRE